MFANCKEPLWQVDDFSTCFEHDYLQVLVPLVAAGASVVTLSIQLIRRIIRSRRGSYLAIPQDELIYGVPSRTQEDVITIDDEATVDDDDDDDEDEDLSQLILRQSKSQGYTSVTQVDRPVGELLLVAVEVLLLATEVGVGITALLTSAYGRDDELAAIAQTIIWGYIFAIALCRLLLTISKRYTFPKLWRHTTFLYSIKWLSTTFLLRSSIIHPISRLAQVLTIAEFSIVTALLLIALMGRKGNRAVTLEYEDGLEPSREPLASLFTQATFGWANPIIWKGYKMTLEIQDVWNLSPKDKAASVLAHFRQLKKTTGLAFHLLKCFKRLLLFQALWCIFGNCFTFLPTLLLKAILEYIEDPSSTPSSAAWFYVMLLFVAGAVQAVADGQALWIGRRICIRLRAIIIGEIYAKALRRKAAAETHSSSHGQEEKDDDAEEPTKRPSLIRRLTERILSTNSKKNTDSLRDTRKALSSVQANVGTVINLMAVDSFKVSEVSSYLHYLWASVPVQIVIAIYLLYRVLGYSSIAGIVMMCLILPLNMVVAKKFSETQKAIMTATDARIHTTNEVLQSIRIIKFFAWEQRFAEIVNDKREQELRALRRRFILWALASTIWYAAPILITLLTFFLYTVVEKHDLIPSVAFTALSLFSLLRVPLDQLADMIAHVQESKVSVDRVDRFLNEEETTKYTQLTHEARDENGEPVIGFEDATLSWGGQNEDLCDGKTAFRLINVDVKFKVGKLNIIAGPTGSGKTSLLMALLGEMTLLEGSVYLPGGRSREDMRLDPMTGLTESVAYCAQQAWLVNATIKQNIIFAAEYDETRYRNVITACALERDLQILDAGDQTLVGEKGIALSGGQKQRISLARALYSSSRHLLLDDCLSAVDSHTANHIFDHCITGPLMYNRTCILVTHNISLCVPRAQFVVAMHNGKVAAQGTAEEIAASGALGEDILKSRPASELTSVMPSRVQSNLEDVRAAHATGNAKKPNGTTDGSADGHATSHKRKMSEHASESSPALKEEKAEGKVQWPVIKMYLKAMGPWSFWVVAGFAFIAQQIGSIATNVWIRQWANAYQLHQSNSMTTYRDISLVGSVPGIVKSFVTGCTADAPCAWNFPQFGRSSKAEAATQSNDVNVTYYLSVYAIIGVSYVTIAMSRELIIFFGSLGASKRIHQHLLEAVMRAKFRFFDSTPLGQIMNRFSKDLESIDQEVAPIAIGWIHSAVAVVAIVILISVITPGFLIAAVFISLMYYAIAIFYIDSARDLKRLESVQRSPLYQQFGETLSGVVTIRAYADEKRFIRDNQLRINTQSRPFIYMWATNRWLAFRVDMVGALVAFFSGAFVVSGVGKIDAGAAGLSLTYAITFTENVLWLVRLYSANEQNMNSVERIKEYLEVEQEAKAVIPETSPSLNWPSQGAVEFINYTTRYRSDLDPVLRDVTFKIRPGERIGVVGRTGAGKSSLALALFRALEAEEGKILIDNVDIGLIGLQQLRESITMVPQDPTLFSGTIRSNLDPFNLFTDEEIFTALRRVYLIEPPSADSSSTASTSEAPAESSTATTASATLHSEDSPSLSKIATNSRDDNENMFLDLYSPVSESGSNLSQGQRQLLCLARALLKNPRVLLMDEATASIDYTTDARIQDTLRELKGNTIITIAHRLQTIIDYDKVLVLDHGEIKEYDGPWELLRKEDGLFRGMCEMSGEMDNLMDLAKQAWEGRRLIDDS